MTGATPIPPRNLSAKFLLAFSILVFVGLATFALLTMARQQRELGVQAKNEQLLDAIVKQDKTRVASLIAGGADPNASGAYSTSTIIRTMLRAQFPLGMMGWRSGDGYTVLMVAASAGDTDITRLLLDKGANIKAQDSDGSTPLMWAAETTAAKADMVDLLLSRGDKIEAQDRQGDTPFLCAIYSGNAAVANRLLAKGANINATRTDGGTALTQAASTGDVALLKALLADGANPNAVLKTQRNTALMAVAGSGQTACIKPLLDAGAKIDAQDANGATALIYAADNGQTSAVALLLKRGANIHLKNKKGETALQIAEKRKWAPVVRLLKAADAAAKPASR